MSANRCQDVKWFIISCDLSDMKRKFIPLILLFLLSTFLIIFYFPPTYRVSIQQYNFSILYLFFASFFFFIFFTGVFIFRSKKHGFFISLFAMLYLLLLLNNLTHPIFAFLLIAIFLVVEFFFYSSKH